jgi:hypothetical protein
MYGLTLLGGTWPAVCGTCVALQSGSCCKPVPNGFLKKNIPADEYRGFRHLLASFQIQSSSTIVRLYRIELS